MTVRGIGNLRNVVLPALPTLPGWKGYEPKTNVALEPGAVVQGSKTLEWLIRPEQPGKTTIPALTLPASIPPPSATSRRRASRSRLVVSGEATGTIIGPPARGAGGTPAPGAENVIAAEIRPIRVRATPGRDRSARRSCTAPASRSRW